MTAPELLAPSIDATRRPYVRRIVESHEIPSDLIGLDLWIGWRLKWKPGKSKPDKIPVSPLTGRSDGWSDNPDFAASFERAHHFAHQKGLHGLGVLLWPGCGIGGIDIDHCRDPHTGELSNLAREILTAADTYFEISPGLSGVRGFFRGGFGGFTGNDHEHGIEFYESGRFLTVTGDHLDHTPFAIEAHDLSALGRRFFPAKGKIPPPATGAVADFVSLELSGLGLAPHTLKTIRSGDAARYGNDRSKMLFATAKDLVKAGLNDEDIARVLCDPANGISAKPLAERGGDLTSAMKWVMKYSIPAARGAVENEPPPDSPQEGEQARPEPPPEPATSSEYPWPEPLDLASATEAEPYPLHVYPDVARRAIQESADYRRAPLAMAAGSALFQMALAAQGLADVARDSRLVSPLSLYLMFFAGSGARKTATDKDFGRAHKVWVRRERERRIDDYRRSRAMVGDYQEDLKGVKDALKKLASKNDDKSQSEKERLRERLIELEQNPVFVIPMPADLYEEFNSASLSDAIAEGWPSAGTASDEAGIVIGSQGFSKENATSMLALLNRLWGADDYIQTRKSVRAAHVRGRRFSTNLMMQPELLSTLIDRGARQIGYLARFLIAAPPSTMGTRFYREPPEDWPVMDAFDRSITALLEQELPIDKDGDDRGAKMILKPPVMRLSPDAKQLWVDFHDTIERELAQFGEFTSVADVASKSAENAARIAGVFSLFDCGRTTPLVDARYMEGGIAVAGWHLHEAKRLFLDADAPPEEHDARELSAWLCGKARELANRNGEPIIDQEGCIALGDITHKGPNRVRDTVRRDDAIDRLVEAGHVRRRDVGRRKLIQLNPMLAGRMH